MEMNTTKETDIKKDILKCAQDLFKQYGLKKTTMDEIAAACGKAKSTLYHYFKNKEEIFDEVLLTELYNIRKTVKEKVSTRISLQDKIKTYFLAFHTEAVNKINIFRILQQNRFEEIAKFQRLKGVIEYEQVYVESMITEAYNTGEYSGIAKEDITLFSEIMVVSFLGLVKYSIEKDQGMEIEKLSKVTDMLIPKIFS
jgi:AcrR family transcriptional regulator